ncbi:MAG: insulinase family protein [Firmicutes bacterium HGW-Firmicutes-16]|nr:MAG: insulinase family protein [Firmicutes bacterium HGW-Firmicutes-16]
MNPSTELIMSNVVLTCLQTDKFKTNCLSVNLLTPLSRETAAKNALIPAVLCRGTATLPDMAAIASKLDSLYGARIKPFIRKKGEIQVIGLYADFADDAFIPEKSDILEQITGLISEMLLMPKTHGGLLLREYVDSEKEQLLEQIRGRINDKRAYSIQRLFENMCAMEEYSTDKLGTESEAEGVTANELTRHYHAVLAASPIEIFYCGSAEPARVKAAVKASLASLPRSEEEPDMGTDIRMNSLEEAPRYFEDSLQVTQGKLAIGFRLGDCMEDPNIAAIRVFNAVYGGSANSKLFMNVREKLSLCYFASSFVDLHKGILAVSSGIEFDKYDAALSEILSQLDAVKRGDVSSHELSSAKSSVASDYRTIEDSPLALEDFYLNQTLIGPDCSPSELAALAEEITLKEVIAIAKGVECDAIYFLRGEKEEA